jgi:MoaA/NifB/PqqE/SkfB family radical SAM enzyme
LRLPFAPPRAGRLRLLILAVSDRCDQRCVHCDIWRGHQGGTSLTRSQRLAVVEEALAAGAREALLTGGEPLLSEDLWAVSERLRRGGAKLMLATNGMLLGQYATLVARLFDEVYVSLDGGEPVTHDRLRGASAFARLSTGLLALRRLSPRPRLVARSVLHAGNLDEVEEIVSGARLLGFDHVSFLPLDATSDAFGGKPETRASLVPAAPELRRFEEAIARLEACGTLGAGFVLEPADKLRRIAAYLRAGAGEQAFARPECDAPSWSMVVEADGLVRPCFFHAPVGDAQDGLRTLRDSPAYRAALAHIEGANPTCERCVCPKRRRPGLLQRLTA